MTQAALSALVAGALVTAMSCGMGRDAIASTDGLTRPHRINDRFENQSILGDSATFSSDGRSVAFTVLRAASSQIENGLLVGEARADVWVQDAPGQHARNLTQGHTDHSGWWAPEWSPDTRRLMFLSSRGGNVTPWIWDRDTGQIGQLTTQGIDFDGSNAGCRWMNSRLVLCLALPEGEISTPTGSGGYRVGKAVERAEGAWAKTKRGELSVSVISSLEFDSRERRLLSIDLATHVVRSIATTATNQFGDSPTWWPFPDAGVVLFVKHAPHQYPFNYQRAMGHPASLDIVGLNGRAIVPTEPLPANVVTSSIKVSPDGRKVAFFALGDKLIHPKLLYAEAAGEVRYPAVDSTEYPGKIWLFDVTKARLQPWSTGDIDLGQSAAPRPFEWLNDSELVFHASRLVNNSRPLTPAASQSIALSARGSTRTLNDPQRKHESKSFGETTRMPCARKIAEAQRGTSALYLEDGASGVTLWRADASQPPEQLIALNGFRKGTARFEERIVVYQSAEGKPLKAKVTLPSDYRPGRRYPLVVDSDIGYEPRLGPHLYRLTAECEYQDDPWGATTFAAAGYIYMFTSMPTVEGMDEVGRANLLMLAGGLLPAVDETIKLGLVDPGRMFLYGFSSMGYGAYALVTQTARFRAAAAEAGWVDQVTHSLSPWPENRYTNYSFDYTGIGGVGGGDGSGSIAYSDSRLPFWRNADFHRRNSPLNYVDRVQTPLLLIAGDMDLAGNGVTQAEMFFNALVQQRKPAQLLRYWGEGHGNHTPANFRDGFQRIFAWYDNYGDIARDEHGNILYDERGSVQSRNGAPALEPHDYRKFDMFGPGGDSNR